MSLKRKLFLDVVVLATLYMARVVAGALVVPVPLSPWFLGFFVFVFLALALVKRQKLEACEKDGARVARKRCCKTSPASAPAARWRRG